VLAPLVQEPDSFSQRIVGLLQLTDPGVEPFDLDLMSRSFGGTRACNRSPFTWRHRHRTTFSRDQTSVEITLKQRVPPPPHLPTRNPMLDQPLSLPAMCEPLILEHHLADLRRRKPCTDRQQPLPPLNASRLTHNQTGKEGFGDFYVCSRGRSGQNQADQNLVSVKPTPIRSLGAPEASNSAYTTSKNHRLT
jgi:hypothetical protein